MTTFRKRKQKREIVHAAQYEGSPAIRRLAEVAGAQFNDRVPIEVNDWSGYFAGTIGVGEWLVRRANGDLEILSDERFQATYKAVKP